MLRFVPLDPAIHGEIALQFRRDSYRVSFEGDDSALDGTEYLMWLRRRTAEFGDGFSLVLGASDEPVGQVELQVKSFEGRPIGYANLFYLVPGMRGQGLGRDLFMFARRWFADRGISRVDLHVSPSNENARRFYEAMGFRRLCFDTKKRCDRMTLELAHS